MKHFPSINEQMDIIRRGIDEIIPEDELVKKLENAENENKPLQIKLGCDPSRPDLHIGHAVVLRKMRNFQDLGHQATLVIGDFTAMIGDPTGRNKTRPQLTMEDTHKNAQSYVEQAGQVLDIEKLKIVYNSEWLNKLNFTDVIGLSAKITVAQMLARDDFSKRYQEGVPISIHEFMYPIAQGYDSVALNSDVELGGTDQKFNLLVGRELQREFKQEPQIIITTPLLEGTDGQKKMSKSYDNYIGITDTPNNMFGKAMSIPDELIARYFEFATDIPNRELAAVRNDLEAGTSNPRDLKMKLGRDLIAVYHDAAAGQAAQDAFIKMYRKKEIPDEMPEVIITESIKLVKLIVENGLLKSNGEARRQIQSGAIQLDGKKVDDIHCRLEPGKEHILKVGKHKYMRIKS